MDSQRVPAENKTEQGAGGRAIGLSHVLEGGRGQNGEARRFLRRSAKGVRLRPVC
jgi:hypothetical protein